MERNCEWIVLNCSMEGRGREVVAEAEVPASVCEKLLHTTPKAMAEAASAKLRIGSDRAVCLGGNNAHAANIVAAIFLATGQVCLHQGRAGISASILFPKV